MKRKAILIESSNVDGQQDLPGARVDVKNWRSFLKSDLGGAWLDSEIVTLNKPYSQDVDESLKVDSDCYSLVVFSGHGSDGKILLNERWANNGYSIANLKPRGNKGTVIIDSCRGVAEVMNFSLAKAAFANESGHAVALHAHHGRAVIFASASTLSESILNRAGIQTPRQKWENALAKDSNGVVQMLACSKGQDANEDPEAGGYYTSLLIQSADLWAINGSSATIHTTKDAHDYAASKLPENQQKPEYSPSWLNFPFAVK